MTDRHPDMDPDTIADDFGLKGLTVENGTATLTTAPTTEQAKALVLEMSLACGRMLDDDQATNYVEFEVKKAGHPGYVVHVRRAERPTPHALRQAADARAEQAETVLAHVRAALSEHPRCEVHPDAGPVSCGWKRAVLDVQRVLENGDTA